jgi:hypothetical protein
MESLPHGQLPPMLWRWHVGLLSQKLKLKLKKLKKSSLPGGLYVKKQVIIPNFGQIYII